MEIVKNWKDFEIIDAGESEKLERWGNYILCRPDPQAIWNRNIDLLNEWNNPTAVYSRSTEGGGSWKYTSEMPAEWIIKYNDLSFLVRPTGFKHTGIFPEQAVNWDLLIANISKNIGQGRKNIKVLNLFGYTGCATVACLYAGAEVCHVDSSKQILTTAHDNILLNKCDESRVRYIVEDAFSFVKKEVRRGNKYDIIIMDPPTFGRGNKGQVWKIEKDLNEFVGLCSQILSDTPIAFILNTYVSGLSATSISNILQLWLKKKFDGVFFSDEIGLPITYGGNVDTGLVLPTGVCGRWIQQ